MGFQFRSPLGLVLSGGGSHGAWQAGCLEAMGKAGLVFDEVFGFSIGSLNGVAYFTGRQGELAEGWRGMDRLRIMRFKPSFTLGGLVPFSFYSGEAFGEALRYATDEEESKGRGRCGLTIVTHRVRDRTLEYARFTPGGKDGWDGPLFERLVASCAVPPMFPPVRMDGPRGRSWHVDGGVPGREPMRFEGPRACADVIVLQMSRPEEVGRLKPWLTRGFDQLGRVVCVRHMDAGIADLSRLPEPPRVFRLYPSRVLEYVQMSFRSEHCAPAYEQGRGDGEAFLRDVVAWQEPVTRTA